MDTKQLGNNYEYFLSNVLEACPQIQKQKAPWRSKESWRTLAENG